MIERLVGECIKKHASGIVVDVSGVGYGVEVTASTNSQIAEGKSIIMWIYTHMNEDSTRLFGFLSYEERQMFAMLLSVNRLGPKIALAIMGTFTSIQLIEMIEQENAVMLSQLPGVGLQSAKKFLLELKPRLHRSPLRPWTWETKSEGYLVGTSSDMQPSLRAILTDIKSALQNLGYKDREILPVIQSLESFQQTANASEPLSFEPLLRLAINKLNRNHGSSDKAEMGLF